MKHDIISKQSAFSAEQMAEAIAAAPDQVIALDCPYDPSDADAVAAFWSQAEVRLPGQRGPQKQPTKVAVTLRYNQDVLDYFRATGAGWQTRMNDVLRDYVAQKKAA